MMALGIGTASLNGMFVTSLLTKNNSATLASLGAAVGDYAIALGATGSPGTSWGQVPTSNSGTYIAYQKKLDSTDITTNYSAKTLIIAVYRGINTVVEKTYAELGSGGGSFAGVTKGTSYAGLLSYIEYTAAAGELGSNALRFTPPDLYFKNRGGVLETGYGFMASIFDYVSLPVYINNDSFALNSGGGTGYNSRTHILELQR